MIRDGAWAKVDISLFLSQTLRRLCTAVFPATLFLPGLPGRSSVEIDIATLPLNALCRSLAVAAQRPVTAVIAPSAALHRRIVLPRAAAAKADDAIALQLRQTLPSQGRGLIWRAEAIGRHAGQVEYDVYILKDSQVADLLHDLRRAGVDLQMITIGSGSGRPVWQLMPDAVRTAKRWMAFSALAVVTIALGLVFVVEQDRAAVADLVDLRSARIADLEERLILEKSKSDQSRQQSQAVQSDIALFAAQSRRLSILSDLTDILPDTVWVSELSITGDRLVLSGFAQRDVAAVTTLIQKLPWAEGVQLNGPISYDSYSGQNRFEVGLTIIPLEGAG